MRFPADLQGTRRRGMGIHCEKTYVVDADQWLKKMPERFSQQGGDKRLRVTDHDVLLFMHDRINRRISFSSFHAVCSYQVPAPPINDTPTTTKNCGTGIIFNDQIV